MLEISVGYVFGRLRVVQPSERRPNDWNYRYFDCECSCGQKVPHVRSDSLFHNRTQSCGCLRVEKNKARWSILTDEQVGEIIAYRAAHGSSPGINRQLARRYQVRLGLIEAALYGRRRADYEAQREKQHARVDS